MVRLPESYLSRTAQLAESQDDSTRVHGGTRWRNPRLDGGRAHATSTSNYIFEPSLDMIFFIIRIIIIIVILMIEITYLTTHAQSCGTTGTGTDHTWGIRSMRPRGSNVRRAPIQTRQWLSMMYPVIP